MEVQHTVPHLVSCCRRTFATIGHSDLGLCRVPWSPAGREKHLAQGWESPPGRSQRRVQSPPLAQGVGGLSQPALPQISGGGVWEVPPCIWALGQPGGPWPGWHCPSPGWCPQLPWALGTQPWRALTAAAACGSPVSLATAGRRCLGKEAGSARKGKQVSGEGGQRCPGEQPLLPPSPGLCEAGCFTNASLTR